MASIVFIHGWCANSRVWYAQTDQTSAGAMTLDGRGMAVDLPGHGGTPGNGATVKECGSWLVRHLEKERAFPAHLVGWSLGAQVACHAALEAGKRVSSITSVGGTPCFVARDGGDWGVRETKAKWLRRMFAKDFRKGLDVFVRSFIEGEKGLCGEELEKISGILLGNRPDENFALKLLDDFISSDLRPSLGRLDTPLYAIYGSRDGVTPAKAAELWKTAPGYKGAEIFADCGHAPFITFPERFNHVLGELIK